MKNLVTKITNSSSVDISFVPTGIIQMLGPDGYKNTLHAQNKYLHQYIHFPVYNITPEQMSLVRDDVTAHSSVTRIVRTYHTSKTGKWFIETNKNKIPPSTKTH